MEKNDEQDQIRAALMLNYCTVSVSQIIDYKDVYILEHEYNAIINNLNMEECLKDEALKRMFNRMLDVITRFRIQEGDRKWLQREYENSMKNALFNCLPSLNVIVAGGNPWTLLISAAHQVGTSYFNYRRNKNQYQMQKEKGEWELTKGAWENFHQLRKELFNAQWDMSKTYRIPDEYLLKEKQLEDYDAILLDDDPRRRLERLEYLEEDFRAFPPFWFHLAQAAGDSARQMLTQEKSDQAQHYRGAKIKYLDQFDASWMPILRTDMFACTSALERIKELDRVADKDKIVVLLDRIAKHAKHERDMVQFCALEYLGVGEYAKGERLLKWLVNGECNIPLNARILSSIYIESNRNSEYKTLADRVGQENVCPPHKRLGQSLDGLKDHMVGDCVEMADQLAGHVGEIWSRLVYSKLQELINTYVDPKFDDIDKILDFFTVGTISRSYDEGVAFAAESLPEYMALLNPGGNPQFDLKGLIERFQNYSAPHRTTLVATVQTVEQVAEKCKEVKPSTLGIILKGGAAGVVGSFFGPIGIGVAVVASTLYGATSDNPFEAMIPSFNSAVAAFLENVGTGHSNLRVSVKKYLSDLIESQIRQSATIAKLEQFKIDLGRQIAAAVELLKDDAAEEKSTGEADVVQNEGGRSSAGSEDDDEK